MINYCAENHLIFVLASEKALGDMVLCTSLDEDTVVPLLFEINAAHIFLRFELLLCVMITKGYGSSYII